MKQYTKKRIAVICRKNRKVLDQEMAKIFCLIVGTSMSIVPGTIVSLGLLGIINYFFYIPKVWQVISGLVLIAILSTLSIFVVLKWLRKYEFWREVEKRAGF